MIYLISINIFFKKNKRKLLKGRKLRNIKIDHNYFISNILTQHNNNKWKMKYAKYQAIRLILNKIIF